MENITCENCSTEFSASRTSCPTCYMDRTQIDPEALKDHIEYQNSKKKRSKLGLVISILLITFGIVRIVMRFANG